VTRVLDTQSPDCDYCGELIKRHEGVEYGEEWICPECAEKRTCDYCGEFIYGEDSSWHRVCLAEYRADCRLDEMKDER
jgi:formylmethanofuran dehydrogenase subunit E